MAIDSGLKKSDGVDLGNNLFAGNGTSNGDQTFKIIMKNGVDLGKGWYNKSKCSASYGNVGFKNSAGTDIGTLLGKYGTLNCDCDIDVCDTDNCDCDSDSCFVYGWILTNRGMVDVPNVAANDLIWGADAKWHKVLGVARGAVGNRKIYTVDGGGIVTDDHVIFFGDRACVPSLEAWHKSGSKVINADGVLGRYSSSAPVEIDSASLYDAEPDTPTFSPVCEGGSFIGFLNGHRVLIAGQV